MQLRLVHRLCFLLCLLLSITVRGQRAPAGVPLGERFDVTGDGIADLIITGETKQLDDPEMGKGGIHTVWLEPLSGVVFLSRCTPNNSDFSTSAGSPALWRGPFNKPENHWILWLTSKKS